MTSLLFALALLAETPQASTPPSAPPVDWYMHVSTLQTGDKVVLRTTDGQVRRGSVSRTGPDSITLRRRGAEVRVAASGVNRLERHDGIWDGGRVGLLVGFTTGVVLMSTCEPGFLCEHSPEAILGCGAFVGGLGFGVGLLFDWMVHGDHTVVQRSAARFEVVPMVTATRKSVAVRVGF